MSLFGDKTAMEPDDGAAYVLEGPWTDAVADEVRRRRPPALLLNYARGFQLGDGGLEFLRETPWLRGLNLLDPTAADLGPVETLSGLEELHLQAAEDAELDITALPELEVYGGEWSCVASSIYAASLRELVAIDYRETDLRPLRDMPTLQKLVLKSAPRVTSLSGLENLTDLRTFEIGLARRLNEAPEVAGLASLTELMFDSCTALSELDAISALTDLIALGVNDCGDVASVAPLRGLDRLRVLYAWGTTKVLDDDLSPLLELPGLRNVHMKSRRSYRPSLGDVQQQLADRHAA